VRSRSIHDDPGHQRGGQPTITTVEGDTQAAGEQGDHLARGRSTRIDPVCLARREIRGVMIDDHARQTPEQVCMPHSDLADPLE
jgi:hypothetical protein